MRNALPRLAAAALIAASAAACSHAPAKKDVVWPAPPDKARIKFVEAFRQTEDLNPSGWDSVRRTLFGASNDLALGQPMGATLSQDGRRLYVADYMRRAIFVADFDKRHLKQFAPDEPLGSPFNVALDAEENVYVSDSKGQAIRVFNKDGKPLRQFGGDELVRPTGIALDRQRKRLYVADSASRESQDHRVLIYDLSGSRIGELGRGRGSDPGQFFFPVYLAVGPDGEVYVGDTLNFRVQVFSADGTYQRSLGKAGDGPATFNKVKGLALDGFGNLYAADGGHSNVQIFNREGDVLTFFGGYARLLEYFDVPSCVAIDPKLNRIYVCNEYVGRINVYDLINTTAEDCRAPAPSGAAAP